MSEKTKQGDMRFVLLCAGTAAFGGLLFGYDTAVVNGAIKYLQMHFELSVGLKGWAASSAIIGCIFGAMFAGAIVDKIGLKKSLILCAILFSVSAVGSAVPRTLNQFIWARFIGGLGVGGASMLAPMYIAEISPEKIRGRLVSLYQLAIVTGIFVVFFINMFIQGTGDEAWNTSSGWRWMFGSEAVPAILFGVILFIIPESPRWLMKAGRKEEASAIITRTSGQEHAQAELKQIEESLLIEKGTFSELLNSGFNKALIIGVMLAIFQQFSGINAIMYYSTEIIKETGVTMNAAFMQTVIIGITNLAFTFVAILFVDKIGRKTLLIGGTSIQFLSLAAVGILFRFPGINPYIVLFFILLYVAVFAAAMGPVVWIMISEIFPNKLRGRAMSIVTLVLWASCYLVAQTFPILMEKIGTSSTFLFYAFCSVASLVFVITYVPETKGKTLEEIETIWLTAKKDKV